MGTFNYDGNYTTNPMGLFVHGGLDVVPYKDWGNIPDGGNRLKINL